MGLGAFGRYAEQVVPAIDWLLAVAPLDWPEAFPTLASYPFDLFDYEAEDRVFADANMGTSK